MQTFEIVSKNLHHPEKNIHHLIMQILIEFVVNTIVLLLTSRELLDKERTFQCTHAISEAMRQNYTG